MPVPSISNGQYGKALQNYLKHVKFDAPETEKKFFKAIDVDAKGGVDEKEAKEALRRLDMFNRPNIDVLTESEVNQIANVLKMTSSSKNISGLEALGTVYDVPGTNFKAVMLKKDLVENILKEKGLTLEKIFENCPGNKGYQVKDGYIVDTSWYQDVALLKAINDANPKLKLAMFNHQAAENVYKVLNEAQVHKKSGIGWFKTGTRLQKDVEWKDQKFDGPSLVSEDKLNDLEDNRFVLRNLTDGDAGDFEPGDHRYHGAVVFGALKE